MESKKKFWPAGLLIFFFSFNGILTAAVNPPFLRVPRVVRPPVIDGDLNLSDWDSASTFCGMSSLEAGYLGMDFDAQWRIAYDQQNLYFSCLTWVPKDTCFLASTTENDDISILRDDHIEIQFSFYGRENAGSLKFYKIIVNPNGAVYDIIYNWLPGQDRLDWSCGKVASKIHFYIGKQHWLTEIAIPLKNLEMETLEGKKMLLQVVRATGSGGMYFSGWVGETWMRWDRFGEVYFDTPVTSFSLLHVGDLPRGGTQFRAIFKGKGYTGERKMSLLLENIVDGKVLYQKELSKSVISGDKVEFKFNERVPIEKKGNIFKIKALQENPEGQLLLYQAEIPFLAIDKNFEEKYLQPWFQQHKWVQELKVNYRYAYAPSYHKVHVWVNNKVNLNLIKEEEKERAILVSTADRFVAVVFQQSGKEIARVEGKIENQEGEGVIDLRNPLPEGKYYLVIQLLNNNKVVEERKEEFVREYFPWENNKLGKEKVVIPPYIPVQFRDQVVSVWAREYNLGKAGLPASIKAEDQQLLAEPVGIISQQEEKSFFFIPEGKVKIRPDSGFKLPEKFIQYWYKASCPKPGLEPTDGYGAFVEGQGTMGKIQVKIDGYLDYTGWYKIKMRFIPVEKTKVESLDLVIPFSPEQARLMIFKNGYGGSGCGAIPEGEGILWESTRLSPVTNCLNSFVPIVYIGNYARGLWWYGEWDKGWIVDDKKPLVQLERQAGKVFLRFRFVNTPTVMEKPAEVEFVLQAAPVKPKPPSYRKIAWKYPEPLFAHDTSGNRYYGNALDTITLYTEEEYQALKDFYYHWPISSGRRIGKGQPEYGMSWLEPARKGYPLVEYGSIWCHGISCKEMPVFKGEWCLGEFEKLKFVEVGRKGHNNYGATSVFNTDEDVTEVTVASNESYIDFFIYYLCRLAEKCGLNGTFYDNWTPFIRFPVKTDITGDAYRRPDGKLQGRFNVFRRHEWTKRLATAFWLLGRPPFQIVADEPDISFIEVSWFVEGHWYHDDPIHDFLDKGITPEKFAALSCKPGQLAYVATHIPPYLGPDGKPAGYNQDQARLVLSYCFLHDLGCLIYYLKYPPAEKILKTIDREVKFFDSAIFVPYWEKTQWVQQLPAEIVLGGYLHPQKEKAVLIGVNTSGKKIDLNLKLDGRVLFGRQVKSVKNLETEAVIPSQKDSFGPLSLRKHEVFFLLVE